MKKFNFVELYGVAFGDRKKIKLYPDRKSNDFEIDFDTPSHSEEDVRFHVSTMEYVFYRDNIRLEIVDRDNGEVLYTSNRGFSMFSNLSGVDPKFGKPTGHPNVDVNIRKEHLLPLHGYTLRVHSIHTPISITYSGTDMNEVELGSGKSMRMYNPITGVAGTWTADK